jgi:type II secretory pathway pseudopilin PulG
MKNLILLFAGIALLTVACKAEMNVLVDINEDRSGTVAFEFGLDEELQSLLESSGGSADDLFGELDLDIATEGGTVIERTEGDMTFTGATKDFEDISQVMNDLVGDTSGDGMFSEFSFVMDDESAALAATASSEEQDMGDLGLDPAALTGDVFSANFILGMPGNVVEHNADEVLSDGRLKWSLPILGGTKTFVAKSEFGGSSLWWLWIVLGVVLVVGVIAIIAAIVLSRRQEKQAVTGAAAQYPQSAADALDTPATDSAAAAATAEASATESLGTADTESAAAAETVAAATPDDVASVEASTPSSDDTPVADDSDERADGDAPGDSGETHDEDGDSDDGSD